MDSSPGACSHALATDVGAGGVCLHTPVMFAQGSAVEVALAYGNSQTHKQTMETLQLRGQVAWCTPDDAGWRCGIRMFMRLKPRGDGLPPGIQSREQALAALSVLSQQLEGVEEADLVPLVPNGLPGPQAERTEKKRKRLLPLIPLLLLGALPLALLVSGTSESKMGTGSTGLPESPYGLASAKLMERPQVFSPFASLPPSANYPEAERMMAMGEYAKAGPLLMAALAESDGEAGLKSAVRASLAEMYGAMGNMEPAREVLREMSSAPPAWAELGAQWLAQLDAGRELPARADISLEMTTLKALESPLHIVIDTSEYLMSIFKDSTIVAVFPVGVGMEGRTPLGEFVIANKLEDPTWYHNGRGISPGDPRNPLGRHWMGLGSGPRALSYGIHATRDSGSIGEAKSQGCIRMRPEDAEALFRLCPVGTPVSIVGQRH